MNIHLQSPPNRNLRVAVLGAKHFPSNGGTSRVIEQLVDILKDNCEFSVFCYKHPQADTHIENVRTIQLPSYPFGAFGVFLHYLHCYLYLLFTHKFDIVHIHKTDAAFFIPLISWKYKIISTSHEVPYLNEKWSFIAKAFFKMTEWIFMTFSHVRTSVSSLYAEYYEKLYKKEVLYTPNGVEVIDENLIQDHEVFSLLSSHHVDQPYMFFAARRIIPLKGLHDVIEALHKMAFKGILVVAGETDHMPSYTHKLVEMAKGLDVRFVGYVGDKYLLYGLVKHSQLFIFPSLREAMSIMLLETGSLGSPMVCSNIPQNTAVFSDEEVLFFRAGDVPDLKDKILYAINHPDEMKKKALAARNKVKAEFSIANCASKYTLIYNRLMGMKAIFYSSALSLYKYSLTVVEVMGENAEILATVA